MLGELKKKLENFIVQVLSEKYASSYTIPSVEIEIPAEKAHGEFSSNIALKSAKVFRKPPVAIAQEFAKLLEGQLLQSPLKGQIDRIEVKTPGFINFFLSPQALFHLLEEVMNKKDRFGWLDFGGKEKIQIEFVSANPTGPLSVAHARQAAVGDALANILNAIGFDAKKEYYVNDEGNQINILGNSIRLRAIEILAGSVEFPEDHYQGDYIKDMARIFMDHNKIHALNQLNVIPIEKIRQFGVNYLMNIIKQELDDFGVRFDIWSHQSNIATNQAIEEVLALLRKKGHIYDKDGAVWFQSTALGDDKDRVVKKSDGSYTYLTPDIVYHRDKFERGFKRVVNIWGPDHHGYVPRIKAAVQALGKNKDDVNVLIVQLATIFRNGEEVSMSTRRGQYISLREVLEEVGADAARFFFLMRHISGHLEFDLGLAKKQSPENPVYYIQYAHARVHSLNKKAQEFGLKPQDRDFSLLTTPEELDLIKELGSLPEMLLICYHQWDPYPLVSYLQELATAFHKFYDRSRIVDPENAELSRERLGLANASRIILSNGLRLLGVSTPEQM